MVSKHRKPIRPSSNIDFKMISHHATQSHYSFIINNNQSLYRLHYRAQKLNPNREKYATSPRISPRFVDHRKLIVAPVQSLPIECVVLHEILQIENTHTHVWSSLFRSFTVLVLRRPRTPSDYGSQLSHIPNINQRYHSS